VIDNRGGAGATLGTGLAAKAAPDGHTLVLVPTSHVINPSIYAKLPYDTEKDFAPITMVASAAILMAVNPRVPAATISGLVGAAKARPQALATTAPPARHGVSFNWQLFKQFDRLAFATRALSGGARR
jgi:tripartite-type tricarboxylate transporter receptor subunit TctC